MDGWEFINGRFNYRIRAFFYVRACLRVPGSGSFGIVAIEAGGRESGRPRDICQEGQRDYEAGPEKNRRCG
jgi:hypothetical protein